MGEVGVDFFPRQQRKITGLMDKHGVRSWDTRTRGLYFRWAGQVSRLAKAEPHRLTPMLLAFRNIKTIREYAARNGGNQGHGRYLHVWRWEADIAECGDSHSVDWQ